MCIKKKTRIILFLSYNPRVYPCTNTAYKAKLQSKKWQEI